jgi:Kef-type K+ transport system membrane component KefB
MDKRLSLAIVIAYLTAILASIIISAYNMVANSLGEFESFRLLFSCVLIGGTGGVLYCFRGVYLNHSVKDQWSDKWIVWYLIRPIVSMICGGISYIFLKAGLLVPEAQKESDASNLGFYALAFIAGMNVDNFIGKLEDLADSTWGIKKSRSSKNIDTDPK